LPEAEGTDVPTLFVKCRGCGHEIPTPVAEPKTGADGVMISGLRVRCPDCGRDDQYSTADFHVPPVVQGSASGGRVTAHEDLDSEHKAKEKGEQQKLAGLGIVPPEGRSPHEGEQ
jgi:ribosomal protein S27E